MPSFDPIGQTRTRVAMSPTVAFRREREVVRQAAAVETTVAEHRVDRRSGKCGAVRVTARRELPSERRQDAGVFGRDLDGGLFHI